MQRARWKVGPLSLAGQAEQAFSIAALQLNSWAEHLPKLTPEAVETMRDTFILNYPGVLLRQDTMPSIRLLSIAHHSLKFGQQIRWIPWQLRLSQKQYQEAMEAKATEPLRTEAQLLSAALFDDTAEMTVQQGTVTAAWHLRNLKAFDKKVAELCLQHFDQDLGLRSPNMQELACSRPLDLEPHL